MIHKILNISNVLHENSKNMGNIVDDHEKYDSYYIEKAFYPGMEGVPSDPLMEMLEFPISECLRKMCEK